MRYIYNMLYIYRICYMNTYQYYIHIYDQKVRVRSSTLHTVSAIFFNVTGPRQPSERQWRSKLRPAVIIYGDGELVRLRQVPSGYD